MTTTATTPAVNAMRRVMCRRAVNTARRDVARAMGPSFQPSFESATGTNDVTGDVMGAGVGLETRSCEAAARIERTDDEDASNDEDIAAMVAGSIASNSML